MADKYHQTRQRWHVLYDPDRNAGRAGAPGGATNAPFTIDAQGRLTSSGVIPGDVARDIEQWIKAGMPCIP